MNLRRDESSLSQREVVSRTPMPTITDLAVLDALLDSGEAGPMGLGLRIADTSASDPDLAGHLSSAVADTFLFRPEDAYPQGGFPVTPGMFRFSRILALVPSARTIERSGGFLPVFDPATGTIRMLMLVGDSWIEALPGTDLSGVQISVSVIGVI